MRAGWHLAACQAAEQALLDQHLLMVSGSQYQSILDMLDRPEQDNPGGRPVFPAAGLGRSMKRAAPQPLAARNSSIVAGWRCWIDIDVRCRRQADPESADKSLNPQG